MIHDPGILGIRGSLAPTQVQAELAAALKGEESDSNANKSDDEDSASSASSFFGLDAETAAPRKRITGKKADPSPPNKDSANAGNRKDRRRSEGGGAGGSKDKDKNTSASASVFANAKASLTQLQQVNAAAIWKGSVKESELQAKLKKGAQSITELTQHQGTLQDGAPELADCGRFAEQLAALVDSLPPFLEVVKKLRSKGCVDHLKDRQFQADLAQSLKSLHIGMNAETLSNILTSVGTKLLEALKFYVLVISLRYLRDILKHAFFDTDSLTSLTHCTTAPGLCMGFTVFRQATTDPMHLLRFITLDESFLDDIPIFSMGSLYNVSNWVDNLLFKTQVSLLHGWVDRVKDMKAETFEIFIQNFPLTLPQASVDQLRQGCVSQTHMSQMSQISDVTDVTEEVLI